MGELTALQRAQRGVRATYVKSQCRGVFHIINYNIYTLSVIVPFTLLL